MKIKYISWLSRELGINEETLKIEGTIEIKDLFALLAEKFPAYKGEIFNNIGVVRASVNGKVISDSFTIDDNSEVTLFAPMSGG